MNYQSILRRNLERNEERWPRIKLLLKKKRQKIDSNFADVRDLTVVTYLDKQSAFYTSFSIQYSFRILYIKIFVGNAI